MLHSKMVKPRYFPWNSARVPAQINRLQEITGDLALNRDKEYEIGREEILDYRKKTPSFTGKLRQFENGDMSFFYDLANKATPGSGEDHFIELDDLKATYGDIAAYLTDDSTTFTGSILFPKLRIAGMTLNIADPDAILERNFSVVGESYKILPENYYAYATKTVGGLGSGITADTIHFGATGEAPVPVLYAASKYIMRVLRVRASVVTEYTVGVSPAADTYAYVDGTKILTVQSVQIGDIIKVYYEAATAYATLWTDDTETTILLAEYAEIYIKFTAANRIYRLQTVGIDCSFERTDYKEIGNNQVVQTGVKSSSVKISLDRYTEGFSLEDILASDTTYPYVDPEEMADDIQIQVKIFADKAHTTFKIGYLMDEVSPTALGTAQGVQEYLKNTYSLETDNLRISDTESEIAFI